MLHFLDELNFINCNKFVIDIFQRYDILYSVEVNQSSL